jgi:1-acyl-sn-glycerol-3-phosphate acyltransferase
LLQLTFSQSLTNYFSCFFSSSLSFRKRPAMFVANHCAWMDIPFMGVVIGWRNYKMIAKRELRKVPILGKAIQVGGHVMVDRSSRKSQLKTLKDGIAHLKNGVHLCTFPEGTRSKSGRLMPFKNGAFKMAQKAGAPVVPLSICNAHRVNPPYWMFPFIASHGIAKVVVHAPIESVGKTEDELAEAVRVAMIAGLPDDQKPLPIAEKKKKTMATTTMEAAVVESTETTMEEASSVTTSATADVPADVPAAAETIVMETSSFVTTMATAAETAETAETAAPSAVVAPANGDSSSSSSSKDDGGDDLLQALRTIHMEPELLKEEKTA